jgi:hypothetical protein
LKEGRTKTMLLQKIIKYRIQWEMKKMKTQFLTPTMVNITKDPSDPPKKP